MNIIKVSLALLFLFSSISLLAQENLDEGNLGTEKIDLPKKNELKNNIGSLVFGAPELSYERLIWDESSLGISVGYYSFVATSYDWLITPYHRVYFGKKSHDGFFVETNTAIFIDTDDSKADLGIGAAIGFKMVTDKLWLFEIYAGGGRTLLENINRLDGYPRLAIQLGKRF